MWGGCLCFKYRLWWQRLILQVATSMRNYLQVLSRQYVLSDFEHSFSPLSGTTCMRSHATSISHSVIVCVTRCEIGYNTMLPSLSACFVKSITCIGRPTVSNQLSWCWLSQHRLVTPGCLCSTQVAHDCLCSTLCFLRLFGPRGPHFDISSCARFCADFSVLQGTCVLHCCVLEFHHDLRQQAGHPLYRIVFRWTWARCFVMQWCACILDRAWAIFCPNATLWCFKSTMIYLSCRS